MLRLNFKTEPYWIDLIEGLRWKVLPFSSIILEQARENMAGEITDGMGHRVIYTLLTKEVAKLVVVEWEGVFDTKDQPLPVTVDAVDFALRMPLVSQMFQEHYMTAALQMGFEKKGFAPLPNGISEGAQDTAATALPSTESDVQDKTPAPLQ
jgi:hypothetical protein